MNREDSTIYIIGSRGRLASSIADQYAPQRILRLDRSEYESWGLADGTEKVARFFSEQSRTQGTVYVCSGLLDPSLPLDELIRVNYHLPHNVIEGASKCGLHTVTFGSIMEEFGSTDNNYVKSKALLSDFIDSQIARGAAIHHIKLHTLYGDGEPSSFMFLGQILHALRNGAPFKMTSGQQLREYHHIDDDVKAIRHLVENSQAATYLLNHGMPAALSDIATRIFDYFKVPELLHVGSLQAPTQDNFGISFVRPASLEQCYFRNLFPSLNEYLRSKI